MSNALANRTRAHSIIRNHGTEQGWHVDLQEWTPASIAHVFRLTRGNQAIEVHLSLKAGVVRRAVATVDGVHVRTIGQADSFKLEKLVQLIHRDQAHFAELKK